jgi:hypothetical protein
VQLQLEALVPSGQVTFRAENVVTAGDTFFQVHILTHGRQPPQVTISGNAGFPAVKDFIARAERVEGGVGHFRCVFFSIRFESAVTQNARAISINLYQEDATEFTFPWFSVSAMHGIMGAEDQSERSENG